MSLLPQAFLDQAVAIARDLQQQPSGTSSTTSASVNGTLRGILARLAPYLKQGFGGTTARLFDRAQTGDYDVNPDLLDPNTFAQAYLQRFR